MRKASLGRSRFYQAASKVLMEQLEGRVMLSAQNPSVPPPVLPLAPTPLQGVVGTPFSLSPQLFDQIYGFNNIYFTSGSTVVHGNGTGQTIAVVDAFGSPTIIQDLQTFDAQWGLSNLDGDGQFALTVQPLAPTVNTENDPQSIKSGWAGETALDVEWAHAVAPGAHILLVEAPSQSFLDLLEANVFAAAQTGVTVVSNSWGYDTVNLNEPFINDGLMVTPNGHRESNGMLGDVAFLASSGDMGTQLNYPAASDSVLPVGGFTTVSDVNGNFIDFAPWSGSGGDPDTIYTNPYNVPIVAADADPATGVWIYSSTPVEGRSGWINGVGGTSLASPAWGAYVTILDQGLALKNIGSLDTSTLITNILAANEIDLNIASSTFNDFNVPNATTYPLWPAPAVGVISGPTFNSIPVNGHTGFGQPIGPGFADFLLGNVLDEILSDPNLNVIGQTPLQKQMLESDADAAFDAAGTDASGPINADVLTFLVQPAHTAANAAITPGVEVEAITGGGALDTTFTGTITLKLTIGAAGPTLNGTVTANAVGGIATFSNLSINEAGLYQLAASSPNELPGVSGTFAIGNGSEVKLTYFQAPTGAWQYAAITPFLQVAVEDNFGNIDTLDTSNVTVSLVNPPIGAVLSGKTTVTTVEGVASFENLSINVPGTYTINVTDGALAVPSPLSFTVVAVPVARRFLFNGVGLSSPILVLQQTRNAQVLLGSGPPTQAQINGFLAGNPIAFIANNLDAAATTPVSAATFASGPTISTDTASLLDTSSSGSDQKLLN